MWRYFKGGLKPYSVGLQPPFELEQRIGRHMKARHGRSVYAAGAVFGSTQLFMSINMRLPVSLIS